MRKITLIIPVYRPGGEFKRLLQALKEQTVQPDEILIMNTEERYWDALWMKDFPQARVIHLRKEEFDHGGTRDQAARLSQGDILLFMTQDAVPADSHMVEQLLLPFSRERVKAAYGRQLPTADCGMVERYTRSFNYPAKDQLKGKEDLTRLGIKTFFCSNVCAAYEKETYLELGGFPRHTIFNEDMIYAGRLVQAGYQIAYVAGARVVHSHNYSGWQQFQRNFDLAVSQASHPEVFGGVSSEQEGVRLVKRTASYLWREGKPWLIGDLIVKSACKYLGYRMGKMYRRLPKALVCICTMNPGYWTREM